MTASEVRGIDLFKIAGRSISGWIPSLKTGNPHHVRQPFCSQLEERLLMYLEYHPQVTWYARGDIDAHFAATYRLPTPKDAPFAIGYVFEGQPHHYLPDVVGTLANGKLFIAEAGMEDEKRAARQQAKAEAARKLARRLGGVYWLATEQTLSIQKHYNFVFLHARRQSFPDFAAIETALHEVWPWGEVASVEEVVPRLLDHWSASQVEAAIWKMLADAAAGGHLLVDLAEKHLDRKLPLTLLPPDASPIVPDPLPDMLPSLSVAVEPKAELSPPTVIPGPPFDASSLEETKRERYLRNLRAVEAVLAGAPVSETAKAERLASSTLSRLVQRTRALGAIACVPYGSRSRKVAFHPAFQECIRRLYLLPTRLSIAAIHEHTEMRALAKRLSEQAGETVALPSYDQVRKEVHRLKMEPELVAMREGAKALPRERQSPNSFALSIPAPALVTQVDEHTMELYVVTPDGITVTSRVHAAVLVCVKTASILAAVLALGPLKEEDYMRLLKQALEPKDRLVLRAGCQHSWPCYGKPAIVFHDRGKIFPSERARQVLVDRLQIITEQAPPYAPSAKGTIESLFRWMTQRFERRQPNTGYGVHDAEAAAQAGGMTLEELERCFYQAVVDDYQQDWDPLRRQRRSVLWEHAVAQSGVPRYLGSPDDLKLLLMKAINHKTPDHRYRVHSGSRLSFHGRWYVSPGLLSRLKGREFEVYYDRRDISVLYLFVAGSYVGEAYCTEFLGGRVSEWEAAAMRRSDNVQKKEAAQQGREARARTQEEAASSRRRRSAQIRAQEQSRAYDRQREEIHPTSVFTPYNHRLGVCLVTAGRGSVMPLKDTLDQQETLRIQFRHRLDKLQPFCRIAGHTSAEVLKILATLETVCRETFPQLNLRRWGDSIYGWLTHPLLDSTGSGRVVMDHLMKLVSNALEWSYEAGEQDVSAETLEKAAELLTLGRNTIRLIDGAGPTIEMPRSDTIEQESGQEAEAGEASAKDAPKQRASHYNEAGETQMIPRGARDCEVKTGTNKGEMAGVESRSKRSSGTSKDRS